MRRMGYELSGGGRRLTASLERSTGPDKYKLALENFNEVRNPGRAWPLPAPTRFYGFPDEAVGYYQNTGFLSAARRKFPPDRLKET